jgi:Clp amino terminal domain, pathogenicity island component
MRELPDLSTLVAAVEERAGDQDPLSRIEIAEDVAAELGKLGSRLIGYFVEQARTDGHSWAQIGDRLGVSRQAAQQRYALHRHSLSLTDLADAGALSRLTERTLAALAGAEEHAREHRGTTLNPIDMLLGILDNAETLAVRVIEQLGASREALRAAAEHSATPGTTPSPANLPLSAASRRVLEAALGEALKLGHNYIGTEHLLLGLLHVDDDPAGRILAEHGIRLDPARDAAREAIDAYLRQRA